MGTKIHADTNIEIRTKLATIQLSRRRALQCVASCAALGWGSIPSSLRAEEFPPRADLDELYDADVDRAVRSGLAFLIARQNQDGTFQSPEQGRWVGVCSLIGLALLSRGVRSGGGEAGLALQRTARYVLTQVQASGFLSATGETSHVPMYDQGFGTRVLA